MIESTPVGTWDQVGTEYQQAEITGIYPFQETGSMDNQYCSFWLLIVI